MRRADRVRWLLLRLTVTLGTLALLAVVGVIVAAVHGLPN